MPSDSALRSLLFESLKGHPKMALSIDKFREAKAGSPKCTWLWLYQKMEEAIEIDQLDEKIGHVEKALQSTGGHTVNAGPSKPEKRKKAKEEKNKPRKDEKSTKEKAKKDEDKSAKSRMEGQKKSQVAKASSAGGTAPGASKGAGKGSKDDRSKQPCMYFAHNRCTKGDKCPHLHDKNNLYSGPLPKALAKNTSAGSATVQAGVAKIVSGAVAACSLKRAEGARSESAPAKRRVCRLQSLVQGRVFQVQVGIFSIQESCKVDQVKQFQSNSVQQSLQMHCCEDGSM